MKSKKVKKIFVICPFPEGEAAGQRLKYEQFFDHWRKNGYEIEVSSFMDERMWSIVYTQGNYFQKVFGTIKGYFRRIRDIFRLRNFDLVYVFMWVTPFGSSFFERLFVTLSHKLIYDIEDNALILQSNDLNPVIKLFKGVGKIEFLIKSANHVITSSPFLNEDCLKLNQHKSCTFISDAMDIRRYCPNNKYSNNKTVVIGWTGTFSSAIYLDLLKNVFFELNKRIDFKLRIIGNFEYSIPGIDLEVIQWSKETEIEDLQGIDIGIYPLTQDKWVLGKSGLKAIQYMALGLPTIATNVGTNPSIIKHMENGLLVKTEQEWILALQNLIEMPDLRAKIGIKARKTIEENYSIEVMKVKYLSILNKLTQ
ncbi:glycosyltransferase family 4 protein [Gammaproteobacteria bacterium]|jgi:L-malate glycosyltransferase|nr:glycosyltransferase family 4 protein [Gammaproteobacteria bacterium]